MRSYPNRRPSNFATTPRACTRQHSTFSTCRGRRSWTAAWTDGHALSKNVNTTRRLLVTRPPRQRPRRIMPVLSHHYVHWHVVFVYGNLLHHLALECTGDQPRARR